MNEALALHLMLRLRGVNSEIVMGGRLSETKQFQAHAWLEVNGQAIIGLDPENSFQRFS